MGKLLHRDHVFYQWAVPLILRCLRQASWSARGQVQGVVNRASMLKVTFKQAELAPWRLHPWRRSVASRTHPNFFITGLYLPYTPSFWRFTLARVMFCGQYLWFDVLNLRYEHYRLRRRSGERQKLRPPGVLYCTLTLNSRRASSVLPLSNRTCDLRICNRAS